MIELRTGVPGSGKTLSAVYQLLKLQKSWANKPGEARPVFVHGIKELALPHAVMPVLAAQGQKNGPAVEVPDWDAMPDGSYVIIDEAQAFFPPRSSQSTPPPHVAWLNTHRHRGFDILVLTQHPKLVDGSMRALCGKHTHYRRLFGGGRSMVYEWDACSDSLSGMANAVTSHFGFPKEAFSAYKSAEVHTRQKFRLPLWLAIPVVAVVIGVIAIPRAYSTISNGVQGKSLAASTVGAGTGPGVPALAGIPGPASPASVGSAASAAVVTARPAIAGCMATQAQCVCVDAQGYKATVSEAACRAATVELGGLIPYDTRSGPTGAGTSVAKGVGASPDYVPLQAAIPDHRAPVTGGRF
jgi:zona occludens toxin